MAANHYDVLNITKDADSKAISDAYKKMALKWHPDKNPDNIDESNQRFKQIAEAYQVLSDSTKRSRYDRSLNADDDDDDFYDPYDDDDDEFGRFFNFISAEVLFRHFFRQNAGFFTRRREPDHGRHNRRGQSSKSTEAGRHSEKCRESFGEESCHTRTVNGKQWMTKTYYENGNKIIARYEDGELVSKQINGVAQKI